MDTLALFARLADVFATIALVGASAFGWPQRRWLVIAVMLPLLRVLLQAASLADPGQFADTLRLVALDTRYGQAMLARAAIVALWLVLGRHRPLALLLAALDIAALALLGHGAASERPLLGALALALHIGAASLWLAGMAAALFGLVRRDGATALRGFAPFGIACVAVLAVTGLFNVQIVTGDLGAAFVGGYGAILVAKLLCFAAMLAMAAVNRFALLPDLDRPGVAAHHATLALAAETILGAVVVGLAALLASGPPA